jgi:putative ABC transport system permease protein
MPLRFVRGSRARLGLTIAALAFGTALVCAMDLVNRAVLRSFVEIVDTMAGRAALQISGGEGGLFPEELATSVGAVSGVELAVPVVSATAFIADGTGELLTVHGVDVANDEAVRVYQARSEDGAAIEDPLVFLSQPDSILLTRALAKRMGLAVEGQVTLETPTGRRRFTIRGLLDPQGVARVYGGNLVVMDIFAAEAAFTRPGFVNRLDIVVDRAADVHTVADAIAHVLPKGLRIETPAQRKVDLHRVMQSLQILLRAMGLVGLVVAFLIAFNRLTSVFEERSWQIGVLRAAGVRAGTVQRELLKEGFLLGAAGLACGIPLGIGIGYLLLPVIATTTALSLKLVAPDPTLSVSGWSLVVATVLGLSTPLLAAALPAWRAARVDIVETLRGRGRDSSASDTRSSLLYRGLLVAGICGAIAIQSITHAPAWGLVATGLVAVAASLAGRPLVELARFRFLRMLPAMGRPAAQFAAAFTLERPRQTALTVAMLGVGAGSVLWLWVVGYSFERSVTSALTPALQGDWVVGSAHVESGMFEAPISDQLAEELRHISGVAAVASERVVDWHQAGGPITIEAFDPSYYSTRDFGRWELVRSESTEAWDLVARGEGIVVSTNYVLSLGSDVGDVVTLETPSGPVTLRIVGVVTDFASPRGTIKISRTLYERLWHDSHITLAFVVAAPNVDLPALRATIASRLGKRYELRILSARELVEYYAAQVHRAFGAVDALAGMVLLVILVGVADTLAAGVTERTHVFGAMRAVGVRRREVRRMVLLEGVLISGLGLVLAAVTGLTLGTLWIHATFPYLLGWILVPHFPYLRAITGALLTIAVCLGAALPSAHRAASLDPAVALRYE